jgi:hypothetical protein
MALHQRPSGLLPGSFKDGRQTEVQQGPQGPESKKRARTDNATAGDDFQLPMWRPISRTIRSKSSNYRKDLALQEGDPCFPKGSHAMPMIAAATAPVAVSQPAPQQMVDALYSAFGDNHSRAVHAKGVMAVGVFEPAPRRPP